MHKFTYTVFPLLFKDKVEMIWIKTVGNNVNKLFSSKTIRFKSESVETFCEFGVVKNIKALFKTICVVIVFHNISMIDPTIIDVIYLSVS
ncbi:MAG: hypothetical protein A3A27_02245 [Candidatus Wildermuthbacteria bacterium RIFCSPLOWO2_01_FULL_47_18]|uniref:Uncharacterized protein n=1 Tax=Candidatus Wildermuthbacteria bacterium RIFCSPLOWO2_01_FULL_47_18 TaxID=1802460 RepID=A0A1G2RJB0_9BACT|nr:MAG: hypothetical protein A3A27_02245 [Candidatus Wildermuthbacteria bacterium RIFCSPLOWO2_01_FULL_47_18]